MIDKREDNNRTGLGGPVVLALDTSTDRGTLAIGTPERLWVETFFRTEKGHTGYLMPLLESTLCNVVDGPEAIDVIAAGTGPGNFTGLKVGVTTAKAMALALDIPMIGVPTLDVLAAGAPEEAASVLALIDARRGLFYAAAYLVGESGAERVTDYECLTPAELADVVLSTTACLEARANGKPLAIAGEAPGGLVEVLLAGGCHCVATDDPFPRAADLLRLSGEIFVQEGAADPASVNPMYLKKPV